MRAIEGSRKSVAVDNLAMPGQGHFLAKPQRFHRVRRFARVDCVYHQSSRTCKSWIGFALVTCFGLAWRTIACPGMSARRELPRRRCDCQSARSALGPTHIPHAANDLPPRDVPICCDSCGCLLALGSDLWLESSRVSTFARCSSWCRGRLVVLMRVFSCPLFLFFVVVISSPSLPQVLHSLSRISGKPDPALFEDVRLMCLTSSASFERQTLNQA